MGWIHTLRSFAWSVAEREAFWEQTVARLGIRFRKPYTRLLDLSQGVEAPQWFVGAEMNIAESCFQAPADQTAIVFQREGGRIERMSFGDLEALCDRVAGGLCALGFGPGDRIAVAMPMTAESVAIYLGIIKAGCAGGRHCRQLRRPPDRRPAANRGGQGRFLRRT